MSDPEKSPLNQTAKNLMNFVRIAKGIGLNKADETIAEHAKIEILQLQEQVDGLGRQYEQAKYYQRYERNRAEAKVKELMQLIDTQNKIIGDLSREIQYG